MKNLEPEEEEDGNEGEGEEKPGEGAIARLRCWRVQRDGKARGKVRQPDRGDCQGFLALLLLLLLLVILVILGCWFC